MKKTFLSVVCLIFASLIPMQAQILFQCNFETEKEFNQFATYDLDGNKPVISDWFGSEPPYKAWAWIGGRAASTSWYEPVGKSNDWLISPAITIPEGTDAVLIWSAFSDSNNGYKIYISTTGNTPTDFTEEPAFSIDAENKTLSTRSVALSQYASKTIYIAWVNDSFNRGWHLTVDDIVVCSNTYFIFNMEAPRYLSTEDNPQIEIQLHNYSNPITSFTANYTIDGQNYSQKYDNLNIEKDSDYNFEIDPIKLNPGQQVNYEVWITTDAYETPKQKGKTARLEKILPRKVVAILNTGTWCGWSPAGTVYTNYMKEHYPESFIVIAAHDGDPMSLYDNPLHDGVYSGYFSYGGNYPSAYFNHVTGTPQIDPEDFESTYKNEINKYTPAKISLSAEFADNSKTRIKINTHTEFAMNSSNINDFTIDFIITENNVTGTGQGYNQNNSYSGGNFGSMGGFENLPNPIPASQITYQDVARGALQGYSLVNGTGFFSTISTGKIYDYSLIVGLPSNMQNADNIEVTALLVNSHTWENREIINADRIKPSMGSSDSFIHIDNPEPGNEKNSGKIELSIPVPADIKINDGQFSLQLPDGISVDEVKTLSENGYVLNVWKVGGGNIWKFSINPENLRSTTASNSKKIFQIFYKTAESIENGDYQAKINDLFIKFSNESIIGEQTHILNITVDHDYTGIPSILAAPKIHISNNILYINTPEKEIISLYSIAGILLHKEIKPTDTVQIPLEGIGEKVLIVKSNLGWIKKIITR